MEARHPSCYWELLNSSGKMREYKRDLQQLLSDQVNGLAKQQFVEGGPSTFHRGRTEA